MFLNVVLMVLSCFVMSLDETKIEVVSVKKFLLMQDPVFGFLSLLGALVGIQFLPTSHVSFPVGLASSLLDMKVPVFSGLLTLDVFSFSLFSCWNSLA